MFWNSWCWGFFSWMVLVEGLTPGTSRSVLSVTSFPFEWCFGQDSTWCQLQSVPFCVWPNCSSLMIILVFFFNCIFLINLFIYLFIFYFWLCWVFVSVRGLSPVAASGGHSSSRCTGLSLSRPLLLRSTGSRRAGSVVVAHGPSCSAACGILPDQGSNPCPLLAGRFSTTAPPGKP